MIRRAVPPPDLPRPAPPPPVVSRDPEDPSERGEKGPQQPAGVTVQQSVVDVLLPRQKHPQERLPHV